MGSGDGTSLRVGQWYNVKREFVKYGKETDATAAALEKTVKEGAEISCGELETPQPLGEFAVGQYFADNYLDGKTREPRGEVAIPYAFTCGTEPVQGEWIFPRFKEQISEGHVGRGPDTDEIAVDLVEKAKGDAETFCGSMLPAKTVGQFGYGGYLADNYYQRDTGEPLGEVRVPYAFTCVSEEK